MAAGRNQFADQTSDQMNSIGPLAAPETRKGYWRRVLRPLFWWIILALALMSVHQHQVWIERTRIFYSVTMFETNVLNDAVAKLDGNPIRSGENISLGSHRLTITQAKAENWETNFFAWYGGHDLGKINLKRAMGTLKVSAEPAANVITITGPEFWLTISNSTGKNLLVPTDTYHVGARYARILDARDVIVTTGNTGPCAFNPPLGAISLSCNETPAAYQLSDANGNVLERGDVPAVVGDLPSGSYPVVVSYHDHTLKKDVLVSNKQTNDVPFHFAFGAARIESVPAGASVYAANGAYVGLTPIVLSELPVSATEYRVELSGYQNATVLVAVIENQTNAASVTLFSLSYVGSMREARQDMEVGSYKNAVFALAQALAAKPGDADALLLQTNAHCRELVQAAKDVVAARSDYIAADIQLKQALLFLPDDAEAKRLLTEYEPHEAAEMVKIKAWKTRDLFGRVCKANPDAGLFEEHAVTITNLTPEMFRDALVQNCQSKVPTFKVTLNQSAENGICELASARTYPSTRDCLHAGNACTVIGTDKTGQTPVRFKLLEYPRKLGLEVNVNRSIRSPPAIRTNGFPCIRAGCR